MQFYGCCLSGLIFPMLLFSAFEIGLLTERFQRFQEKILSTGYTQLVIIFIRTEYIKAFKIVQVTFANNTSEI